MDEVISLSSIRDRIDEVDRRIHELLHDEPALKGSLEELEPEASLLRMLGSYPCAVL